MKLACMFGTRFGILVENPRQVLQLKKTVEGRTVPGRDICDQLATIVNAVGFGEVIELYDIKVTIEQKTFRLS